MLVAALEVIVGLPRVGRAGLGTRTTQLAALHQYRARRRAGIDPDVERVGGFADRLGAVPVGRLNRSPQVGQLALEPDIGAVFLDEIGSVTDDTCIENRLALRVIKRRDRHAPRSLPGDAPVGARLHGALDSVSAPAGHPIDAVDRSERLIAKPIVVDVDEPLIHRAKNHRRLAAPTVRVAVLVFFFKGQFVPSLEQFDDGFICLASTVLRQDLFTDQFVGNLLFLRQICSAGEASAVIDRRVDW